MIDLQLEVMLDPSMSERSDPPLRLAGTRSVLVEFPCMSIPPESGPVLFGLKMIGWLPVIAPPERYASLENPLAQVEAWRRPGALLQVDRGRATRPVRRAGAGDRGALLDRGLADYLSSDSTAGALRGRGVPRPAGGRRGR